MIIFVKSWTMKTTHLSKDITTKKNTNWALPDQTVSPDEFKAEIQKAEQGPFITPDEFEQRFEEWKLRKGL
jgi:hypothetical protein